MPGEAVEHVRATPATRIPISQSSKLDTTFTQQRLQSLRVYTYLSQIRQLKQGQRRIWRDVHGHDLQVVWNMVGGRRAEDAGRFFSA